MPSTDRKLELTAKASMAQPVSQTTVCSNGLKFINIDLSEYCKEKDIEICAVKLIINSLNMCIITIYRAPAGNFSFFLQSLDNILQSLYTPASHIIICGDLHTNYLVENEQKKQLDTLLLMYNLTGIVNFPSRINNTSASAIDNIFIDISRFEDFSVFPFSNDLSDHVAQILAINIPVQMHSNKSKFIRKMDKHTILDFTYNLSNEEWDSIFNNNDVKLTGSVNKVMRLAAYRTICQYCGLALYKKIR